MRYMEASLPSSSFPNVGWRNAVQSRFEVPTLVRLLRVPSGGHVLEIGCGRGVALEVLARALEPAALTGVDVDEALLEEAAARAPSATLTVGDVRRLPFGDGSFDVVVDFGTLHHVDEPADALREVERVLHTGGLLVHETRVAQLVAHPRRFSGAALPWAAAPRLSPVRSAGFWALRRKDD